MFKAMGPRGTLGPGPLGANWAWAPGDPLGPGPKGANWARAPGEPLGPGPKGSLGPGPQGPHYELEPVSSVNRCEPEPMRTGTGLNRKPFCMNRSHPVSLSILPQLEGIASFCRRK